MGGNKETKRREEKKMKLKEEERWLREKRESDT